MASNSATPAADLLREAAAALRVAALPMALAALLAGAAGAWMGRSTGGVTSSAQLLLTPSPLRENFDIERSPIAYNQEDAGLARMLPAPLEAKTAGNLCTSDSVLEQTRERARTAGLEFGSLNALRGALKYEITVDKESPYFVNYSPIIALHAAAATPADARALVNAWAEASVEAGKQFHRLKIAPAVEALERESQAMRERVEAARGAWDAARTAGAANAALLEAEHKAMMTVHADVLAKLEYARIALSVGETPLALLSEGGEWAKTTSRRYIVIALAAGFWAAVLAGAAAVATRIALRRMT